MLGVYDFCGHYEWTFEWLRQQGGETLVQQYWEEAISLDSQRHAEELIRNEGIDGMKKYWGHTLAEEAAGYTTIATKDMIRIDMHACPSKGFLLQNRLCQYHDYCDHCMGWIQPLMQRNGYVVDHEHNHQGQCWWEIRRKTDQTKALECGQNSKIKDVRSDKSWNPRQQTVDRYIRSQRMPPEESDHLS